MESPVQLMTHLVLKGNVLRARVALALALLGGHQVPHHGRRRALSAGKLGRSTSPAIDMFTPFSSASPTSRRDGCSHSISQGASVVECALDSSSPLAPARVQKLTCMYKSQTCPIRQESTSDVGRCGPLNACRSKLPKGGAVL
ncbi:hypothetical protein LZ30DRAFT_398612 [Colletotrichum cereale]|nr:hypothetical protein LZ30DRAFT_398612 [Colletotrichum cereale]